MIHHFAHLQQGGFAMTPELREVITSLDPCTWDVFVELCVDAFAILRERHRLVMSYAAMLMAPFQERHSVHAFIGQRLRLEFPVEVALEKVR